MHGDVIGSRLKYVSCPFVVDGRMKGEGIFFLFLSIDRNEKLWGNERGEDGREKKKKGGGVKKIK